MNRHPYLRAYMAGITVPTVFLLAAITAFTVAHFVWEVPMALERAIVFPMAVVPNAWGAWNMLWVALGGRRLPVGVHGALLPVLLAPAGYTLARALGVGFVTPAILTMGFPLALIVYYLVWKHAVGFFNELLGVA